ncbi:M20/M25/M40 family metallo-hydrolase [Streptomyces sp. NPDC091292]|uniref:M20/M25/M40 family metallo-hydrolase n=1 Tax=Streptomyces sp. NPDC091292 TaxID=3365991 RepID=UPI0037FB7663
MMSSHQAGTAPDPTAERAIGRLADLVSVETPSGHAPGLSAVHDALTAWAPPGLGAPERVVRDGVPHLYWPGDGAPGGVLLLGHADTVWPLGTLAAWPFTRDGDHLSGPGVFDMKAGLVIALDALERAGDLRRGLGHVRLLVTGDEETGSRTSRDLIEDAARDCAAVLVLEPADGDAAKVARKGAGFYRLAVDGRAAHAGLEPETGVNALVELAHQVIAVNGLGDGGLGTTVTPTVAQAGTTSNTVPEAAHVNIDVRAWDKAELERVDEALRSLTARHPEASLRVSGGVNRPPLERALSAGLLETARRVAGAHGLPAVGEARVGGASDGNFTAALGVPTLDGLGARGDGAHARHEWVDARSLGQRATLVAGLIEALRP